MADARLHPNANLASIGSLPYLFVMQFLAFMHKN